jgi:hypothetical protein
MGRFERRLRFFRSLIRLAITDGREKLVSFVKREAIGAESLEDSAFAFVPSRWIVVRPKTSSKLEARLHIA